MINVNTISQYKVLEFIKNNFDLTQVTLELVDNFTIKVIDKKEDFLFIRYDVDLNCIRIFEKEGVYIYEIKN